MKFLMMLLIPEQVNRFSKGAVFHLFNKGFQLGNLRVADIVQGQFGCHFIQSGLEGVRFPYIFSRHFRDKYAPARFAHHQSFGLQEFKSLPYRRPADIQTSRNFLFFESLPGLVFSLDDPQLNMAFGQINQRFNFHLILSTKYG